MIAKRDIVMQEVSLQEWDSILAKDDYSRGYTDIKMSFLLIMIVSVTVYQRYPLQILSHSCSTNIAKIVE